MEIYYDTQKLRKSCNDSKEATKQWGYRMAETLVLRQNELRAATNLSDLTFFDPCRLHELTGNLRGIFSVDLVHPYRLLFKPNDPVPHRLDGGIDRKSVTEIVIVGVEDTHDHKS